MDKMKTARGLGFPAMLGAAAMALTVNAAFVVTLTRAGTDGQRIYSAWIESGGDMVAAGPALNASTQLCSLHAAARTTGLFGKALSWL
jgi:hypothetical protein